MNSRHSASRKKVYGTHYGAQPASQDLPTPPMSRQGTAQLDMNAGSSPRLQTQYLDSSPESAMMDYESDHDVQAFQPYDRRQTMQILEEEEQNQKQLAQADSVYPKKTKRKHKVHSYTSQPPAQLQPAAGGVAFLRAMQAAGLTGDQISKVLINGRQGHKYGKLRLRGNGSALEGNTFNDDTMEPFLARHEYGDMSTSKAWTGNVYRGNHHSSAAQAFMLNSPSAKLPAPPSRVSNAVEESDSESNTESEDEFS